MIDQIDLVEAGSAKWAGGRVVAVYDQDRQAILGADVAIGATVLGPLDTVEPFNPSGGEVGVTLPETAGPIGLSYTAVDYEALTLTLIAGPAVLLTAGSIVRPDPALVDRMADVREGTQDDPIACRVPYTMRPWLPVGTRAEGKGEEVLYGPTVTGYVLHDVLGSVPLLPEGGSWVGDMPVGTVMAWPSTAIPARWLKCDGTTYPAIDFPELFALLGATYGGDGATTFAVPNLIGRFPRGSATPAGASDVATHAHGVGTFDTANVAAHEHGNGPMATTVVGDHAHGGGPLGTGTNGGHDHGSAGSHAHGATDGASSIAGNFASGVNAGAVGHTHGTNTGGSHGHGSVGGHAHGVTGNTAVNGDHSHLVTGTTATANAHGHTVTGSSAAASHLPPYLDLLWIIKAIPGGDPLADGSYVEVRDEGIPDVPAATVLDFRGAGVDVSPAGAVAVVTIGAQSGVTDHGVLTGLGDDDHPQYHTDARGDLRYSRTTHAHAGTYEPAGAVAAHAALPDPHPSYLTAAEGNSAYEPSGAVAVHAALADPHSGYATDSELSTAISDHLATITHDHPDVAAHDAMGLASDAALDAHTSNSAIHGGGGGGGASAVFVNVKDPPYNATGNGSSDDTAAILAAIAALSPTVGGTLYFPPGDYLVNTSALVGLPTGTKILGAGRSTKVRTTSGAHNLFEIAAGVNSLKFEDITFSVHGSGGHVFVPAGSLNRCYWLNVTITQNNPARSILKAPDSGFLDNKFEACVLTHNGATSVPAFDFTAATGSRYNSNTWERCQCNTQATAASYFFDFATSSAADYNYDNTFRDLTMEFSRAILRVRTGNHFVLDGINVYLEGVTTFADLIYVGKGAGGVASRATAIKDVHRKNGGGALGAGLYDVKLESGGGAVHTHITNCNTATLSGFAIDLGSNNNVDVHGCVNATLDNPGATNVLRSEAGVTPSTQAFGDAAAPGTSLLVAREDHRHGMPGNLSVQTAHLADDAVTFAKLQNVTGPTLIGRTAATAGDAVAMTPAAAAALLDHGSLQGLADDDHPQYLTPAEHLAVGDSSPHHARQHDVIATADHVFPGGTDSYLRADGSWAVPPGGGGGGGASPRFRGLVMYLNTAQSIPTGTDTELTVNWLESIDTDGVHAGASSAFTVPAAWNGLTARLIARIDWVAGSGGYRRTKIWRGGLAGTQVAGNYLISGNTAEDRTAISPPIVLVAGEVYSVSAHHNLSGAPLNIQAGQFSTWFAVEILGVTSRTRAVWFSPDAMGGVTGAALTNYGTDLLDRVRVREYGAAANEDATISFRVPDDWVAGTALSVVLLWAVSSTGAGDVVWRVGCAIVSLGENIVTKADPAVSTLTVPAGGVTNGLQRHTIATDSIPTGPGDFVKMTVQRMGASALDTFTGVTRLVGAAVQYTADS